MHKSFLAALILALGASSVSAQSSTQTPRPLIEWDIAELTPESLAACGAFLSKTGLLLSRNIDGRQKSDESDAVAEILFRGIALSTFSKETDPELQAQSFAAEFDPKGERGQMFFFTCTLLADSAIENGMIPQDVVDHSMQETVKLMLNRP